MPNPFLSRGERQRRINRARQSIVRMAKTTITDPKQLGLGLSEETLSSIKHHSPIAGVSLKATKLLRQKQGGIQPGTQTSKAYLRPKKAAKPKNPAANAKNASAKVDSTFQRLGKFSGKLF